MGLAFLLFTQQRAKAGLCAPHSSQQVVHRQQRRGQVALAQRFAQVDLNGSAQRVQRQVIALQTKGRFDLIAQCIQPKEGVIPFLNHP